MAGIDRIETLRQRDDIVGLDFVFVRANQTTLFVFFHPSASATADAILGPIQPTQIKIYSPSGGESLANVLLNPDQPPAWVTRSNRTVLRVDTAQPGDFSRYRFQLNHDRVDPYFREVDFSFKANCESQLDCAEPPHECPADELVDYPVNYQARDFWSIRQALLDFASERHPDWKDRLEADLGMMLAEVMSALGDEFAYYQDRISREAYFDSATQRRSLRRQARMVDYELHDGKGGTTWLDFTVDNSAPVHVISAGTPVWAPPPSDLPGDTPAKRRPRSPSIYEVGNGIVQGHNGLTASLGVAHAYEKIYRSPDFNLRNGANRMPAYQWDENETCLPVGSISLHVTGHRFGALPLEDFTNPDVPGKWVVLQTNPRDAGVQARTWRVRLIEVDDEGATLTDPLTGTDITKLEWEAAQATPFEMELETLVVRGNIVPATAGQTLEAFFQIEPIPDATTLPSPPPAPLPASNEFFNDNFSGYAIERSSLLFTLPGSEQRDVVSHGPDARHAAPEVRVLRGDRAANAWPDEWEWKRSLMGIGSSLPSDTHFTLDDGSWRRVASYRRVDENGTPQQFFHFDYAGGRGTTVRFGNGQFGQVPNRGSDFRAVYRLGSGRADNVAADSLSELDTAAFPFATAVTNPFGVEDAVEPETLDEARHFAPDAFRAETFRAVRAEDYIAAVNKLDWVQRAGAQFRWTGSWLTVFATPDPKKSFATTAEQRRDLERQLDRYRLAGREAHGMAPRFVNLDLEIHVCVAPASYIGEVKNAILKALFGRRGIRLEPGFFSPDRWTFGDSLERARLEAVIQSVPGVRAVEQIYIRRRGWFAQRLFNELVYRVAANEIIRVENNFELPERGAVRLELEGGA